jgi:flagellar hook assembly protein FlgD
MVLQIFDVRGALVKVLYDGSREPGRYETIWNGDSEQGRPVATGVYFYELETSSGFRQTRKMILIK